jgi:hypothetical protein
MGLNARSKGQRGEREIVDMLQPIVDKVYGTGSTSKLLQRNAQQSSVGGHDIVGLDWIALEVKRVETSFQNAWWEQCKRQALVVKAEPVLIYRQSRQPWKVRMYGHLPVGSRNVKCVVDIDLPAFLLWFEESCKLHAEMGVD